MAYTTQEAAERLGITADRVRKLIRQGRIPATLHGDVWYITPGALEKFKANRRPTGRPKKQA